MSGVYYSYFFFFHEKLYNKDPLRGQKWLHNVVRSSDYKKKCNYGPKTCAQKPILFVCFFLKAYMGISKWLSSCSSVRSSHLPLNPYHHIARLQLHPLFSCYLSISITQSLSLTHPAPLLLPPSHLSPAEVKVSYFSLQYLALYWWFINVNNNIHEEIEHHF